MATVTSTQNVPKIARNYQEVEDSILLMCGKVGDIISPLYGPKGLDKLVQYSDKVDTVLNDASRILETMCVPHPVVKMIADAAETAKILVGDGITTTVLLARALIIEGMKLRKRGIAPSLISAHYFDCLNLSLETLRAMAQPIDPDDQETLIRVASTALSKLNVEDRRGIAETVVKAVGYMKSVAVKDKIDLRALRLDKKIGGTLADSYFMRGVILDNVRTHVDMPKRLEKAKVALIWGAIMPKNTAFKHNVRVTSPTKLAEFTRDSYEEKRKLAQALIDVGANVIVSNGMLDKHVEALLAQAGIFAVQEVPDYDLECLMKATGATILPSVKLLSPSDLGFADVIEEAEINGDPMTFVRCENGKAGDILIRGASSSSLDSAFGAMADAVFSVRDAIRQPKVVGGGGAVEMAVATKLRKEARTIESTLQISMESYANAVESIVRVLCANSSLDGIDGISDLRRLHWTENNQWLGIDSDTKCVVDTRVVGIIHPLEVVEQAFESATEVAAIVLRISHIIQCPPKPVTIGEMRARKLAKHGSGVQLKEPPRPSSA